jgi:hypothetical protein
VVAAAIAVLSAAARPIDTPVTLNPPVLAGIHDPVGPPDPPVPARIQAGVGPGGHVERNGSGASGSQARALHAGFDWGDAAIGGGAPCCWALPRAAVSVVAVWPVPGPVA